MIKKVITYTRADGGVSILYPTGSLHSVMKDIPEDATNVQIVPVDSEHFPLDGTLNEEGVPNMDRMFRDAWKQEGKKCVEDVDKCKEIAHAHRRRVRDEEFKPLDRQVTIPLFAEAAEADRQKIREKHAVIQVAIDAAETPADLKEILAVL